MIIVDVEFLHLIFDDLLLIERFSVLLNVLAATMKTFSSPLNYGVDQKKFKLNRSEQLFMFLVVTPSSVHRSFSLHRRVQEIGISWPRGSKLFLMYLF